MSFRLHSRVRSMLVSLSPFLPEDVGILRGQGLRSGILGIHRKRPEVKTFCQGFKI